MIRKFVIGLSPLFLAACFGHSTPPATEFKRPPADIPDAALVEPCDTSEGSIAVNGDMFDELAKTRRQRNDCAGKMDGVRQWRSDAIKRADDANKPTKP